MSPITQLSALAFAAGALAVPGAHNNFHAWQVNHAHGRFHSSKSVAGTASSGTAAGTGVPYPYPNANGTAIGGSTGFATGTAPVSISSQAGPKTQTVFPVGYGETTTSVVTTSVAPSSTEVAPAGYDSSSSACGSDVTVTTTEKTYITVTAGGASSSVEASATQPSSSSGRKTSTVTQYSTYYPSSSSSSVVESSSPVSSSVVESAAPSSSSSQTSFSTSYSSPAQYTSSEAAPQSISSSYSAPAQSSSSSEAAPEQATSSSYAAPAAYSSSSWAAPESTSSSYSAPAETSSTWAAPETTSSSYSAPAAYSTSSAAPSVTFSAGGKGIVDGLLGASSSAAASTSSAASATPSSYSSGGSSSGSFSGKRGLAYNDASLTSCFGGASKVGWAYNWGSSSDGLDMDVSYVPLLWGTSEDFTGAWSDNAQSAIDSGSQYLFSFNEPDMSSQANLSPEDAAEAYKKYMSPFAGKAKMCAPSVTNGGGSMGLTWLSNFLDACSDCQIDCINIHWYDSYQNTEYFKDHVTNATEIAPGKEVFISEFGTTDGSDEQVSEFLQDVMPWMDSKAEVAGYAYFMVSEGMLVSGDSASSYGSTYMNYSG
ncbi:glycoside hydrolase family 128 protein [Hortaea werneckii]|nr:glycoside hydrolase family 128 protein [Hortaea werneckii]KAI7108022.1 glycoside hydrolase family 128 protein [Hortaea werneckii]KAI7226854.1 glycoside hydrolase family 128 protein [Hortaea werneckii]KAI7322078.1 glycoside hydrolase family 128 protein [Hortaea werneckii]KAI7390545.1 glycoside hydrolase family 128 protein [Hortaea werneckii]